MKKILILATVCVLCFSMISLHVMDVYAQDKETTIFQDNFESYESGSLPSSPWVLLWNGAGNQYQMVNNTHYHSPTRSLQLMGSSGHSAVVTRNFATSTDSIGYEAYIMSSDSSSGASIAFFNQTAAAWGKYYAMVQFMNGSIWGGHETPQRLQDFTANAWYKIRVTLSKTSKVFSVWINDVLVGQNLAEPNNPNEIASLQLQVGWLDVLNYFDDVKVFSPNPDPGPNGLVLMLVAIAAGASIVALCLAVVALLRKKNKD